MKEEIKIKKPYNTPIFNYSSNKNGEEKYIKFYKDSIVWGNELNQFSTNYASSVEIENLFPRWNHGYDVKFSKNYIAVGVNDDEITRTDLLNQGVSKMFFSLNEKYYYHLDRIYSINYKQEYLLTNIYEINGKLDSKYPLVVSEFEKKTKSKPIVVDLHLKNEEESEIINILWNQNYLILSYLENDLIKEKTITITK